MWGMQITRFLFETDQGIVYEATGEDVQNILESVEVETRPTNGYSFRLGDPPGTMKTTITIVLCPDRMRQYLAKIADDQFLLPRLNRKR